MKFCVKQILFKHIHVAAAIVKACKRVCCVSCKCNVYAWSLPYMLVNQTFNCTVLPSEYPRMPKSKLWLVDKQATKTYTTWILAMMTHDDVFRNNTHHMRIQESSPTKRKKISELVIDVINVIRHQSKCQLLAASSNGARRRGDNKALWDTYKYTQQRDVACRNCIFAQTHSMYQWSTSAYSA